MGITKEEFNSYRKVQFSGKFNMFDPRVRNATALTSDQLAEIMERYGDLEAEHGEFEPPRERR